MDVVGAGREPRHRCRSAFSRRCFRRSCSPARYAGGCSSNSCAGRRRSSGATRSRSRSMTRPCESASGTRRRDATARPTAPSSPRRLPASGRSRVEADRGGQPVAAMVIDDALAEDPELVRAATSATVLAVENGNLEGQLRASQLRVREVGAAERKRIEDNLHDSAQQRLVALRIRLELASERLHGPEQARAATPRRRGRSGRSKRCVRRPEALRRRTRPPRRRRRPQVAGRSGRHARRRRGPRVRTSFRAGRDDRVLLLRRGAAERHQARRARARRRACS